VSAATYEWALRRIDLLESVIARANPLGWVASGDMGGAQAWERMAAAALQGESEDPPVIDPKAAKVIADAREAIRMVHKGKVEAKTVLVREGCRSYFVTPREWAKMQEMKRK
jgi:hypothetical protein